MRVFSFKRVTATKFTGKSVIWGKFCILHFVTMIKRFVSEVLYAFKDESRLVAPTRKFIISNG